MTDPLRIAIVATPRSGNTWLRAMLGQVYAIPTTATHELGDDDWGRFPPEVVHQVHWPRTPEFLDKLRDHGFRVVTLARHPLDTLISILHFAWYDRETASWLLGREGDETGLCGAMPRSRPFLDYAAGPRAAALLSVTCDWWQQEGVTSVRYEDLVRDPAGQLAALAEVFGPPRCESVADAVAACAMGELRKQSLNNHFWKGKPGLWRDLLPAGEAGELAAALAPVLARLGYEIDPDPALDAGAADRNWVGLVGPELTQSLAGVTAGFQAQLAGMNGHAEAALAAAAQALRERDQAVAAAARLQDIVDQAGRVLSLIQAAGRG